MESETIWKEPKMAPDNLFVAEHVVFLMNGDEVTIGNYPTCLRIFIIYHYPTRISLVLLRGFVFSGIDPDRIFGCLCCLHLLEPPIDPLDMLDVYPPCFGKQLPLRIPGWTRTNGFGWMNLFSVRGVVFLGPQNDTIFEGKIGFLLGCPRKLVKG